MKWLRTERITHRPWSLVVVMSALVMAWFGREAYALVLMLLVVIGALWDINDTIEKGRNRDTDQ